MLSLNVSVDSVKTLIEHAAASINYDLANTEWVPPGSPGFWGFKRQNASKYKASHFFNPLASRSTALDIAIHLNICCKPSDQSCKAYYDTGRFRLYQPNVTVKVDSLNVEDKQAAMCEAITRAAAIIQCRRIQGDNHTCNHFSEQGLLCKN